MKALSILQPFAWLIVHGHKDIENRGWHTPYRGRFIVHAGKRYPRSEHDYYAEHLAEDFRITLPPYEDMPRGCVVGFADVVDCVREHPSRWKMEGTWGFVLANARPVEIIEYRGQLGFFNVDRTLLEDLGEK